MGWRVGGERDVGALGGPAGAVMKKGEGEGGEEGLNSAAP